MLVESFADNLHEGRRREGTAQAREVFGPRDRCWVGARDQKDARELSCARDLDESLEHGGRGFGIRGGVEEECDDARIASWTVFSTEIHGLWEDVGVENLEAG